MASGGRTGSEVVAWGKSLTEGLQATGLGPFERGVAVGLGALLVVCALAAVAYRRLGRDSTGPGDSGEPDGGSDRDGEADVTDVPERFVEFTNAPSTYVGAVLSTLLLGGALDAAGYPSGFVLALYGPALFALMGLLKFGWPKIEAFYERRETVVRDPESLRYGGISTDAKVFLTLFLLCFLGLLLVVVIGGAF